MVDTILEVGDEVTITIPRENREWGYNPCPDGSKATVIGFSEIHYGRINNFGIKPGVYVNRMWVNIRLTNGKEYAEYYDRLTITNKAVRERRWRSRDENEFLRDLPETPFWEGDFVRLPNRDRNVFQIVGIDYQYLAQSTAVGTKYPAYRISEKLGAGWHTSASEDDMVLVERGPVWKFHHDEPIDFSSILEEAQFFDSLGHTEEVRNPATGLYEWTKQEVLAAIRRGTVHCFSLESDFGAGSRIIAKRFKNQDLGRRVAQATLRGFADAPA